MASDHAYGLRRAVSSYVGSLCACIEAAKDVQAVAALLQQAQAMLLLGAPIGASHAQSAGPHKSPSAAVTKAHAGPRDGDGSHAAADGFVEQEEQALADRAQDVHNAAERLGQPGAVQAVFWGAPFAALAAVLLSGASGSSLLLPGLIHPA